MLQLKTSRMSALRGRSSQGMNFPNLTCKMSPVINDLEDVPTDLDVNYEEGVLVY